MSRIAPTKMNSLVGVPQVDVRDAYASVIQGGIARGQELMRICSIVSQIGWVRIDGDVGKR